MNEKKCRSVASSVHTRDYRAARAAFLTGQMRRRRFRQQYALCLISSAALYSNRFHSCDWWWHLCRPQAPDCSIVTLKTLAVHHYRARGCKFVVDKANVIGR